MRRAAIAISCTALALAAPVATASASSPASASANCVGVITSQEGSQLPGSVGGEVSGLARSVPMLGHALVSPLALEHGCG